MNELATSLDSSTRNLKEDFVFFRSSNYSFTIETGPLGVRIRVPEDSGMSDYYQDILKKTLTFQIMAEIFFDETLTVNQLAVKLKSSASTIYRTIDDLNDYFNQFQCQVYSNPCRINGDEDHIRNFYRAYFKEVSSVMEWPFRGIDESKLNDALENILQLLQKIGEINADEFDFAYFKIVKIILSVNLIRYNHGHYVEDKNSNRHNAFTQILVSLAERSKIVQSFKDVGISRFNTETLFQLFSPYFKENFAFSERGLKKLRKKIQQLMRLWLI